MKIISWNTNGLRATLRDNLFFPLFEQEKPDILCLQETKAEPEQLPDEAKNISGYHSYFDSSKIRKGHSGVAVYTKIKPEKVEYGIGIQRFDEQGRILVLYFKEFVLINCYFPNGGGGSEKLQYKLDFYDAFLSFADKLSKKHSVLFCGDVNVAHEEIDLARPKENMTHVGFLPEEREWVDEVVSHGFTDVFRYLYPTQKDAYTYWDTYTRARDRNVGWRIDYFFASPKLLLKVKSTKILSDWYGSDHCPISIEIK